MIYLDNAASTRIDDNVLDIMLPFFNKYYGNSNNITHKLGIEANKAVVHARNNVANILGCLPQQIFWTSGSTESNNIAILGLISHLQTNQEADFNIVTSAIEHRSVLHPIESIKILGGKIIILEPELTGKISVQQFESAIMDSTKIVCIMHVNNELGVINNIQAIGEICNSRGVYFHCDATQAVGKVPVILKELNVDSISISAHKFHGPKGVGCLYIKDESLIKPTFYGGGQENGIRPGTLNVPGIVGLSEALSLTIKRMDEDMPKIEKLRDKFESIIEAHDNRIIVNGKSEPRVANISNISFPIRSGYSFLELITENGVIACSSGSACDSADNKPSHVMKALGKSRHEAKNTLRFSLSKFTTDEEIEVAAYHILELFDKIKL
ncbi:MAG TPA: cysteine desulfurase family protein [Saprospiraceae bacterium]|nr:cysteine desulfurase family protein [Saprospiraceae bacterium]